MKISGRTIKRRLYGLRNLPADLKRARYFRGHGVHSPFVYAIVRQVFMRSTLIAKSDTALFDALTDRGISARRAVQLQNIMIHCGYTSFGIDCADDDTMRYDFAVATLDVPAERLEAMAAKALAEGATLCIMSPWYDRRRDEACRAIIAKHRCTDIDNRGYLLLFNNYLPKQSFRL